jgi:hypothetical protein
VSWLHPYKEQLLVLVGERKMAVFNDGLPTGKVRIHDKGIDWQNGLPVPRRNAETLLEVDSTALSALADAARYSARPEIAVRALVASRQRFPKTPFAHAAAFFLGRLADDRGAVAEGLVWYRRYLGETPDGPYAAEALGRKMLAVERISGREASSSVAREYVARFPNGTYMLQAHAILATPAP